MLKRNTRLKKEYLYRKNLEVKERLLYDKKRKIRETLAEGKPIPTELRNEEAALRQEIDLEDEHTAVPRSTIDDEYANETNRDPKILLTTSRDPSSPLTQFVKVVKSDISKVFAVTLQFAPKNAAFLSPVVLVSLLVPCVHGCYVCYFRN